MARVFSGIQPSGELHIGNYLGAVQNWVRLQPQHDCLFSIVDLHAITQPYDAATLASLTLDMAVSLYAVGLDPEQCIVFVQSHVAEHTDLNWLLTSVTPLGELERQTQFKDKAQRQESVPAGLLAYPILQAADVLLYKASLVPVGEDQVQHLHRARGLLATRPRHRGRAQLPDRRLGLSRLQAGARGQHDSDARAHARTRECVAARARDGPGAVARGSRQGTCAGAQDHGRGAGPDGIPQGGRRLIWAR